MKYIKIYENYISYNYIEHNGSYYFTTDNGYDYKVLIEKFKDGNSFDFAIYDSDNDIYSFDFIPSKLNLNKLFNTLISIIKSISGKFYLIANTNSKYRLYRMFLNKMLIPMSEESSKTGINKIIIEI